MRVYFHGCAQRQVDDRQSKGRLRIPCSLDGVVDGGLDRQAAELGRLGEDYLRRMVISDSGRFGGLKFGQLTKFLRGEFPHTGWTVCRNAFTKNWYTGGETGPFCIVQLAWRTKDPLKDGSYLVYALSIVILIWVSNSFITIDKVIFFDVDLIDIGNVRVVDYLDM